jgi:hypothetical protein
MRANSAMQAAVEGWYDAARLENVEAEVKVEVEAE